MATKQKKAKQPAKKQKIKHSPEELDRRWSILLFGLGAFFILLSIIPGESGWAWLRANILFGIFGISGWLLGPACIFIAVLISLSKPFAGWIVRCVLLLLTLSGFALVFGSNGYDDMGIGDAIQNLFADGRDGGFQGGVIGLVFGWTLLALFGRTAARALFILLLLIVVMILARITPGDIAYFLSDLWKRRPKREKKPTAAAIPKKQEPNTPPVQREPIRAFDLPLTGQAPAQKQNSQVDIGLGPDNFRSDPGQSGNEEIEIGPGGTFGMNPLRENTEEAPESELLPFDPTSTQSLFDEQEVDAGFLLFGDDDPLKPVGGADSQLQPVALPPDIEFIPPPAPEFDLFGRTDAPVPVQFSQQPDEKEKPLPEPVLDSPPPVQADPAVDALIDKAASEKPSAQPVAAESLVQPVNTAGPYDYPPINLFQPPAAENNTGIREEMRQTADLLVNTLTSFGVQTRILDVCRGPSVTRYEVQPQAGVKISKITNLADDIALNLAAAGVRIEAPIPGKPAVGIEVANQNKTTVSIRSILESQAFALNDSPLAIALGKDIAGECVVADLTKMPHLLIAGSTGSGKSVCVNATIMSFLYKSSPEDVRLLLIDPKVVELAEYNGIPHLLMPVVTEPRKAAGALGSAVAEMERRYHLFAENNVRDIRTFNKLAARDGMLEKLPYIAIVIDELADLMMTAGKEVEDYICRIAQKARAAGMHLIVATQRPSVDVITGLIKANIPSRIAFAVSSQVDSRTILDGGGAEKLLGMGDMLFMPVGANKPVRVQGTYVQDKEISSVLRYIKQGNDACYDEEMIEEMERRATPESSKDTEDDDGLDMLSDPVFVNAVEIALENGQISTSFLQRRLRLGYARAGRITDEMERLHIISPPDGSKPRQVLITREQWLEMSLNSTKNS